jgi:Holliday junction resolvase-like predicted endonuclease
MDLAVSIERRLAELKSFSGTNFSENQISTSDRGLFSEYLVYKYFKNRDFTLLGHRYQTPFAEVDLIFKKAQTPAVLIEVKSTSSPAFFNHLIQFRQKAKLLRAREYLEAYLEEVVIVLATVRHDASIEIFEDF